MVAFFSLEFCVSSHGFVPIPLFLMKVDQLFVGELLLRSFHGNKFE